MVLFTFRHLDAIYKVNRFTGRIVWKLGGVHTSKSLTVKNDPDGSYPLGAQHDARVLGDGTVSIFNNNTGLAKPGCAGAAGWPRASLAWCEP